MDNPPHEKACVQQTAEYEGALLHAVPTTLRQRRGRLEAPPLAGV